MRMFLVVLAACAGHAATPAPAPLAGRSAAPATAPVVVAKAVEGRAVAEPSGEWVDIIIEESGEVSLTGCTRLLEQVTGHITRACEARPLPPIGWHGVALMTVHEVDENAFALDDLLAGKPQVNDPAPFKGRRIDHEPHADAASCEATVATRNGNERNGMRARERERIAENDRRLGPASEAQDSACTRSDEAQKRCLALSGESKKTCVLDAMQTQYECEQRKRERKQLEDERAITPHEEMTNRRCVAY